MYANIMKSEPHPHLNHVFITKMQDFFFKFTYAL